MGCRHMSGFTCWSSRLNLRASEKMGGLKPNNEDLFFPSTILSVENSTSEDVYNFFLLFTIPIFSEKIGHVRT